MALGGGTFLVQNKVLPGAYINFVSLANATATLSDRGFCTMPLDLDWGVEGEVFEVTAGDFQKNSMKIFAHAYMDEEMKGLRDLFLNAQVFFAYRLNTGGTRAENAYAKAKYNGTRGNDLRIIIQANVDDPALYDVFTYMGIDRLDEQTVSSMADLEDNDFVIWKRSASLALTASMPLSGGTNGSITGMSYQNYLDKIESYAFNTMGVVTTEGVIKTLFASFCKRMRDEVGKKFQLVLYDYKKADYMGTISLKNKVLDDGWSDASGVFWVTGASCGCPVNKSLQNRKYNGEFTFFIDYTQRELEKAILSGEWTIHSVNGDPRVLDDINTMVTTTDTEGDVFKDNQTIRVIDQIGNDIAVLFATKYLGVYPNIESGRTALWSDIVKHHEELQSINAIENFDEKDVVVTKGTTKKAVAVSDAVEVVNAMGKLYMTAYIS